MSKNVVIIGTLDTKGQEFLYVKKIIESTGAPVFVLNTGVKGAPFFEPDIPNTEIAIKGGSTIADLVATNDRGMAIDVMMKGAYEVLKDLYQKGQVGGVISLGGTAGTTIGTYAMKALPVGVPKLMVSTVASGNTRPYVGEKDVTMMYSVVDISGINNISKKILANAAYAIAGMVNGEVPAAGAEKPLIAATMFGVTTPCVTKAREYLESQGYEVLVFHATGAGGMAMEALVEGGFIKGVLDITTTEWCDELVGGVLTAGPNRLDAAAKHGVPQVVSVGALDMVNFGPMDTVPEKFRSRKLYKHNATISLMRTTVDECAKLGEIIGKKVSQSTGKACVYLPLKGVSAIDVEGQPFYGPDEDKALFENLKNNLSQDIKLVELDTDINNESFALEMAKELVSMIENK